MELGRKESVELPWGPSGTAGETCTPMAKSDGSFALVPQAKTFQGIVASCPLARETD